jgi:hypothetical protein
MVYFKLLLLAVCLALSSALPAQLFRKTGDRKNGINSTRVSGTYGVDLSSKFSQNDFSCLKSNGFDYAIIRGYESFGAPDPNAAVNIQNARDAGFQYVDVYMFPCPQCSKSATDQVKEMVDALSGSNYGQIWLDIEGSEYWLKSYDENQQFFEELFSAARDYKTTGVYASKSQWIPIMGDGYSGGSSAQLWYAHYDDNPSFSDFEAFGGWSRPAIKQYEGDAVVCGVDIDKDWY